MLARPFFRESGGIRLHILEQDGPVPRALTKSRRKVYSSPSMLERQRRILRVTQRLIEEVGASGFGIRDVCRRASVVSSTIYKSFHSRDYLLALAVQQRLTPIYDRIGFVHPEDSLEGMMERLLSVQRFGVEADNHVRALTYLCYAGLSNGDIKASVANLPFLRFDRWLERVHGEGELEPWVERHTTATDLANLSCAVINEWSTGRLDGAGFRARMSRAVLSYVSGVTQGAERQRARDLLADLAGDEDAHS